jgi:hypothetical protein
VLNREFSRLVQDVKAEYSYSESMGLFSLSAQARGSQIFGMSEDLQRYMGFDLSTVLLDPVSLGTMAKQAFDVNRGLNLLCVYCDVATHTIVGNTKTPLIRAATSPASTVNSCVTLTFNRITYRSDAASSIRSKLL